VPRPARVSRGEHTRQQILDAATEHFARHGFAGARVDAIAHDANLVGPAVLYHFGDKRQLYVAALERTFAGLLDEMERALFGAGSLSERIERAVSTWVSFVGARPAVARILLREGAGDSPGLAEDLAPLAARVLAMLDRIYQEGRRKRVFRSTPVDPLHVVSATVGATVFFVGALPVLLPQARLDPLAPERLEAHRRELLTIVRRLLGIRAPRAVGSRRAP
jgi:TetR/AcrR family transcriptional regulator